MLWTEGPDRLGEDPAQLQDLPEHERIISNIMDQMSTNIYVSDVDTGAILFMNKAMKRAFGVERPEGRPCWEVLQKGMKSRCPFCPIVRQDRAALEAAPIAWEAHNARSGRIYQNYASLMRRTDGTPVYFCHSLDVTEARRLSREASYDELTGLLNRRAGKKVLQEKLDDGRPFAVCILDVNGLRELNDARGHQAGDELLVKVAEAVQGQMGPTDCLFRLSGDEFVALLDGADRAGACRRMAQALDALREGPEEEDMFCFGVSEAAADGRNTLSGLLGDADSDLYAHKRKLHILRAEERLRAHPQVAEEPSAFTYDQSLLYDALLQSTDDYLYVCNMKTGVFRYSQAMVDEFGLPGQIVENAAAVWGARVHEHDKAAFLEANQDIVDGRSSSHCVEYRAQNRKGEWLWMRCRGRLERDENGEPALFAGFITNLGKKNQFDQLTGLQNRLAFEEECGRMLESGPLALMIFDIDDLSRINSLYDRALGDEVIRIVAQRLQSLLPPNAQVFRLDGDEFGVLIRGSARSAAQALYRSIRDVFSTQQSWEGKKFYCALTCGCALAPEDGTDYLGLLKRAHCAMDYAKRSGKDRMEFYSEGVMEHLKRDLELVELLRESMERDFEGFRVFLQPVFRLDRTLLGAEAVLRWSCGKYGEVSPVEFIELLESSGLILRAGRWIFQESVRRCAAYLKRMPGFQISVNLSILQLDDPDLTDFLTGTVEGCGVPPSAVILEMTESCLASNLERYSLLLDGLRDRGFRVAMDDFGTGYSSLGLLKQAPVDIVKLDATFVRGILESPFDRAFIRLATELCHIVGMRVCLEGVETEEECEVVSALGVDYLQGFLLGRPCDPETFEAGYLPG